MIKYHYTDNKLYEWPENYFYRFSFHFFPENRNFDHRHLDLNRIIYQRNIYPIILKPYTFNGKQSEVSWPNFTAFSDLSLIPLNFFMYFWPIVITSLCSLPRIRTAIGWKLLPFDLMIWLPLWHSKIVWKWRLWNRRMIEQRQELLTIGFLIKNF